MDNINFYTVYDVYHVIYIISSLRHRGKFGLEVTTSAKYPFTSHKTMQSQTTSHHISIVIVYAIFSLLVAHRGRNHVVRGREVTTSASSSPFEIAHDQHKKTVDI